MKNTMISSICVFTLATPALAQQPAPVDTLCYDRHGKGVAEMICADYYRIVLQPDSTGRKPFRDFYRSGELKAEGEYLSLNPADDTNSVLDGRYTGYYKSGNIARREFRFAGRREGEYVTYYENGSIRDRAYYHDDRLEGTFTLFDECGEESVEIEYAAGEPRYDYYIVRSATGGESKFDLKTHAQIWQTPAPEEMISGYRNGEFWNFYTKNGITLGVRCSFVRDYGKYYRIDIRLENNTAVPLDLDPRNMYGFFEGPPQEFARASVLSARQYMKIVSRRQAWNSVLIGAIAGVTALGEEYVSRPTSHCCHHYEYEYDYDDCRHHHSSAHAIACDLLTAYVASHAAEKAARNEGYLRQTTVLQGETVIGHIHIRHQKGQRLYFTVDINGILHAFEWDTGKVIAGREQ